MFLKDHINNGHNAQITEVNQEIIILSTLLVPPPAHLHFNSNPRCLAHMPEHPTSTHLHHCFSCLYPTTLPFCLKSMPVCASFLKGLILLAQKDKYTHTNHMFSISPCFIISLSDNHNRPRERQPGEKMYLDTFAKWRCGHDNPCTQRHIIEVFFSVWGLAF